jgi:hypothetical protein
MRRCADALCMARASNLAVVPTTTDDRCLACDGKLVEITLSLDAAGSMAMQSCSRCDLRSWRRDGSTSDLTGVLASMASGVAAQRQRVAERRAG